MLTSFAGHAVSLSECVIGPKGHVTGLTGSAGRTPISLPTGSYAMATAEHREPCESRGSCTVLGAPWGEIPPGRLDTYSPRNQVAPVRGHVSCSLQSCRGLTPERHSHCVPITGVSMRSTSGFSDTLTRSPRRRGQAGWTVG